jgi:hypothetical protein
VVCAARRSMDWGGLERCPRCARLELISAACEPAGRMLHGDRAMLLIVYAPYAASMAVRCCKADRYARPWLMNPPSQSRINALAVFQFRAQARTPPDLDSLWPRPILTLC